MSSLQSPFPWFGGKSKVAGIVWSRFGNVKNYVEPFFGSGAVLLKRPESHTKENMWPLETVNDLDGYVANFWRAITQDPEQVAHHADWPVNENDLHARHIWLVNQRDDFIPKIEGDPDFFDAKIAGYWVWGICAWIGSGFCSGKGPWRSIDEKLVKSCDKTSGGLNSKLPHLGNFGMGVQRNLPRLGNDGCGVFRKIPDLGNNGRGANRNERTSAIIEWMTDLYCRLRRVRVCCGDWSRVCGPSVTFRHGITGVFLDPPYGDDAGRNMRCYRCDSGSVAGDVRKWAVENGDNPLLRIALCGYEGEHIMPDSWACVPWKANGGYSNMGNNRGKENANRERIWFSPNCINELMFENERITACHQ